MGTHATVTVRAPAKVNLQLTVGAPSADGFHPLATVFQAVGLYDEVTATNAPGGTFTCEVSGVDAALVPSDSSNLAVRAARALVEAVGPETAPRLGVHLSIRKQIPVAGGMAGGSADAAAALLACDTLWGLQLDRSQLADLAAGLGSDVPFSLLGGTAVGMGRGDRLTPALGRGTWHWVLLVSTASLSTPTVYAELDRLRAGRVVVEPRVSQSLMQALRSGDPTALGSSLHNDLQHAAVSLLPELDQLLELVNAAEPAGALVSGSGPTVAVLAEDEQHAAELAVALADAPGVGRVLRASGPVPGCRVVDQGVRGVGS
ncbi:4-(cytidine 5'-diphospho)-2-C-methyl-D-erythritol kinase [Aquipuribacter sp. MA13-6]|uniref:4-(cytidine 5'-diphospho)-2-C-methyl-D-erythritol kinase n=1 Tax=unclassified Aquipuribacter TaxID=2635084 RepID=UPI003EF01796